MTNLAQNIDDRKAHEMADAFKPLADAAKKMLPDRDDGGPAFPVSTRACGSASSQVGEKYGHQDGSSTWQFGGMTLRDYFAAHAPPPPTGWLGASDDANKNLVNVLSRPDNAIYSMIEWRWFYAENMLAARKS